MKKIILIGLMVMKLVYGQPTDFFTKITSGGYTVNALVHLPPNYYSTTKNYQCIIMFGGTGQVGTDTTGKIAAYGPHDYLRTGWDGGVPLALGTYYPILITIQFPALWPRPNSFKPIIIDSLRARYRIDVTHLTGLSMGGWASSIFVTYQPTAGDHTYQNFIKSIVNLSGVIPSDNFGATPPYPDRFADYAAAGGKGFFTDQAGSDVSDLSVIPPKMNAVVAGSATFELTSHGCNCHGSWEYEYGGNGSGTTVRTPRTHVINGKTQTIYQYMLRTGGDTSLSGGNQNPTVSITSPAAGATFTSPASVPLAATASDADGTISKVEFYDNGVLINTDNSSPYSYTYNTSTTGTHVITAKAYDNSGGVSTSAGRTITVNGPANSAPAVSITSPASGTVFTAPATIIVNTSASDIDGTISNVQVLSGSGVLNTDVSLPYTFTWTGVPAGTYTITSKATDNLGAVTTSAPVTITVTSGSTTGTRKIIPRAGDGGIYFFNTGGFLQPGDTGCIAAGANYPYISINNVHGTAANPVVIINCGGQVTYGRPNEYGWNGINNTYIKITGTGDPNFFYGFKTYGTAAAKYGVAMSLKDGCSDYEIDHIDMNQVGNGFLCKVDPVDCNPQTYSNGWVIRNPIFHDCRIRNSTGEAMYIVNTASTVVVQNCSGADTTIEPVMALNAKIYNMVIDSCGWDGIQLAPSLNSEIYNNVVTNYGLINMGFQQAGILLGGKTSGSVHDNYIRQGTGNGMQIFGSGLTKVYNNVIVNAGFDGTSARQDALIIDDRPQPGTKYSGLRVEVINNTIVNSGRSCMRIYNSYGTMATNNRVHNNLLVQPNNTSAFDNKYIDLGSGVNIDTSNNMRVAAIANARFENTSLNDFHLLSNSPAINVGLNAISFGITNDYDGVTRPQGAGYDAGAYEFTGTTNVRYYFSTNLGDDSRTATQAQNPATPWRTIAKLNSYITNVNPGDSILFRRGEIFPGTIDINKSGSATSPIVISAYGTGAKPIINGMVTVTGWTSAGGGVYESSVNSILGAEVKMLSINGAPYAKGRYPNIDAANKGYLNFETHNGNTQITDAQLTGSPNWTGAELVLRKKRFVIETGLITNHSGSTLTYNAGPSVPLDGFGYFVQNDVRTLDQFGEWYYNPATKKISMYFGGTTPSSVTVQANYLDTLVSLRLFSYITFDNLSLKGGGAFGFDLYGSNYSIIKNCDINLCGEGIKMAICNNPTLVGNTINNSNDIGLDLVDQVNSATVRNNLIKNTGLFAGMAENNGNAFCGLISVGNNNLFEYNRIDTSGFAGFEFYGDGLIFKNNFINYFALTADDVGGIYASGGTDTTVLFTNRTIQGNIVLNGIGIFEGTTANYGLTGGIYLDNNCSNIRVIDNTVSNNYWGIIVHNSKKIFVRNNTMYNNTVNFYMLQNPPYQKLRNDTVRSNIIFSKSAAQKTGSYQTTSNDILYFGQIDSNFYARPIDDNLTIQTVINYGLPSQVVTQRNLSQWQTYSGFDINGGKSPRSITNENQIDFRYNATQFPASFTLPAGNYIDVKNVSYSGTINLQPYTSSVLIPTSGQIAPVITWSDSAAITHPAALSPAELNAVANVSGTYAYSPGLGTILNAGPHTLSITFTPTDQTTYSTVTKTVTLIVNKGTATISLSNLTHTYDSLPKTATVTTSPPGLGPINITYGGVSEPKADAGSYPVVVGLNNPNWQAANATGTLVINKATAVLNLLNLAQNYNGAQRSVTVTTSVGPLTGITILYNGAPTPPSAIGSYAVTVTLSHPNFTATSVSGTLVISPIPAGISITNLNRTYTGFALPVTVNTNPAGVSYALSYNGSPTVAISAGTYIVIATINDGVNTGSDTQTLVVAKAQPALTWNRPQPISYNTPLGNVQLNASANIGGSFAYTPPAGTTFSTPGMQTLSAVFTPEDTQNYLTGLVTVPIQIFGSPFINFWIEHGKIIFENNQ